jgi:peptidyl-tRNA hydrolase ICT1
MRSSLVLFQVNTAARSWLQGLTLSAVPRAKFAVTFSRASGPGGQKVNKTSSKSTITLPSLQKADWIPQDVRHQLKERRFRYLTKSGSVVISSDVSRSQQENLDLCFDKFCNEVKRTSAEEDK